MIENITWRSKVVALFAAMLVSVIVFALNVVIPMGVTIAANSEMTRKLEQLERSEIRNSAEAGPKESSSDDTVNLELSSQQRLFKTFSITSDSLNLSIENFSVVDRQDHGQWVVLTNKCTVSGNFLNIVRMIHVFENSSLRSKIAGVKLYLAQNQTSRLLRCDLFAKSIVEKE